jgi:hypothetical protein
MEQGFGEPGHGALRLEAGGSNRVVNRVPGMSWLSLPGASLGKEQPAKEQSGERHSSGLGGAIGPTNFQLFQQIADYNDCEDAQGGRIQ